MQCWSGRVNWEGFRAQDLLRLAPPKTDLLWVRVDCADKYYDFVKLEDLLHPRTLFALGMNGEALSPNTARRCGWSCRASTATSRRS